MYFIILLFFFITSAFAQGSKLSNDSVYIEFKSEYIADFSDVTLGQISKIEAKDQSLVKILNELKITTMPFSPDLPRQVSAKSVLMSNLSNLYPRDQIVLKGAEKVTLKTKTQILPYANLLAQSQTQVKEFLKNQPDSIFIDWNSNQKDQKILNGIYNINIRIPQNFAMSVSDRVYIDIFQFDKILKTVTLPVKLRRFSQVALLQRNIERGQMVESNDIQFALREINDSRQWIRSASELNGQKALRSLTAGRVLFKTDIEMPWVIEREQTVKIIHEQSGFKIEAAGISREKGRVGDIIRIQNNVSNKTIRARVLNSKEVSVIL
jgi:flagella basal body P-ring formation protein FlgA